MNNSSVPNTTTTPLHSSWNIELTTVFIIDFMLIILAIAFNLIGMVLQFTTKTRDTSSNQSYLLIHLSAASMISVGTSASAIYHKAFEKRFPEEFIVFYYVAYMSYIINLVYLSADRFLFVFLNLRYYKYVTKRVLLIAIVILWQISIGYGLFIKYAKFINHTGYKKYASHVYNGFVCLFTVLAYAAILIKLRFVTLPKSNIRGTNGSHQQQKQQHHQHQKIRMYIVPFLIVSTFFLFNIVPAILAGEVQFSDRKDAQLFIVGLIGVNVLNNISDPLFYIFLQPKIQKKLKKYLMKLKPGAIKSTTNTSAEFSFSSAIRTTNVMDQNIGSPSTAPDLFAMK